MTKITFRRKLIHSLGSRLGTSSIITFAGSEICKYSYNMRELAKKHLVEYSYLQGVGIHWGLGASTAAVLTYFTKKPLLSATIISGLSITGEFTQYLHNMGVSYFQDSFYEGRACLEDVIGGVCGAIIGSYGPQVLSKITRSLEKAIYGDDQINRLYN